MTIKFSCWHLPATLQLSTGIWTISLQYNCNFIWTFELKFALKKKKSRPDGRLGGNSLISLMLRMWFLVASTVFAATKEAKEPRLESPGLIVWSCKFTNCVFPLHFCDMHQAWKHHLKTFGQYLEGFSKFRRFHYQFILGFFKQVPREPFSLSTTRLF